MKKITCLLALLLLFGCGKSEKKAVKPAAKPEVWLNNLKEVLAASADTACGKEGSGWTHKEGEWFSAGHYLEIGFTCKAGAWQLRKFEYSTYGAENADKALGALRTIMK